MHLDHLLVSQSAMVAVRPIKEHRSIPYKVYLKLNGISACKNAFIPNTYVDISNYIDTKIKAMSFKTQLKIFPHPRSLEAIEALSKFLFYRRCKLC